MDKFYASIVGHPGRWVIGFVLLLVVVSALPSILLEQLTPWPQSPDWARVVFQFGALVLIAVGGVIPIAKWYEDRIKRITEEKPIVLTDCLADGSHQIRNVGNAPAVNVWLVIGAHEAAIGLGSLDTHEARTLHASVVETINAGATARHILLAAARPGPRPYTVTFNTRATEEAFCHGFDDKPGERLTRNGTVDAYLRHERVPLLAKLDTFADRQGESDAASK